MKDVLDGIARTVLDGIRDAEMQYGYAEKARESGKADIAIRHNEEAKRRLQGVKEWYDIGMKLVGDKLDPLAAMLMEHNRKNYRSLIDKVATFKPGA